ncbi:MAG: uroporphyrinogen-III synthase [Thermoanaerobaculia bacterium]|nr:uroporphyrinogen-III synthase [Thermoanaerobaculia bacterium]
MRPKVLVVRSGGRPFFSGEGPRTLEVRERVSHAIVPCLKGESALDGRADLAIFTSQVAAERLLGDPELASRLKNAIASGQIAAVGTATGDTLARYGMPAREIGGGSARSLLERLPLDLSGKRILLPRGEDASTALEEELRRRGASVEPLVLYRKVPRPRDADLAVEIVREPFAAFCVTATSAARWLFEDVGQNARERLRATPAVALGPSTRRFLLGQSVSKVEVPDTVNFTEAARLLESLAVDGVRT